jgi:hypothetical protein
MAVTITGEGEVAGLIGAISDQLASEGAWFNPDLEIRVDSAGISMVSRNAFKDLRSVIRVPVASMPVLEDFDISLIGNEFRAEPRAETVSKAHIDLMQRMLDVFNVLGKAEAWRETSPWFSLSEHEDVLEHFLTCRPYRGRFAERREKMQRGEWDALTVDTFMGSRKFNLNANVLTELGREAPKGAATVLMPIIDYFNHNMNAQSFNIQKTPAPMSMRIRATPHPDTGELFVRYNVFDMLDTYLNYGFVEPGVGYLVSMPCEIKFDDVTLRVIAAGNPKKMELPKGLQDLRIFLPAVQKASENTYNVTKLVIPGPRAPRALRRVLQVVLNSIGVPEQDRARGVVEIEEALLAQNEAWWTTLAEKSTAVPEGHMLHDLCRLGRAHIEDYKKIRTSLE